MDEMTTSRIARLVFRSVGPVLLLGAFLVTLIWSTRPAVARGGGAAPVSVQDPTLPPRPSSTPAATLPERPTLPPSPTDTATPRPTREPQPAATASPTATEGITDTQAPTAVAPLIPETAGRSGIHVWLVLGAGLLIGGLILLAATRRRVPLR